MSEGQYSDFTFPTDLDPWVLWMSSPSDAEAHPMLVLKAGDNSIEGIMYSRHADGAPEVKTGVRHVADPWLQESFNLEANYNDDAGVFVEMPSSLATKKRLALLEQAVAARDELLYSLVELANKGKDLDDPTRIPDLREVAARLAANAEPDRPNRGRGRRGPPSKEPTAPAKGVRLSELMGR